MNFPKNFANARVANFAAGELQNMEAVSKGCLSFAKFLVSLGTYFRPDFQAKVEENVLILMHTTIILAPMLQNLTLISLAASANVFFLKTVKIQFVCVISSPSNFNVKLAYTVLQQCFLNLSELRIRELPNSEKTLSTGQIVSRLSV